MRDCGTPRCGQIGYCLSGLPATAMRIPFPLAHGIAGMGHERLFSWSMLASCLKWKSKMPWRGRKMFSRFVFCDRRGSFTMLNDNFS